MKENFGDLVIDKLIKRREAVRAKLAERYKRTKPFRMEKVSGAKLLEGFNEKPDEEKLRIFQELGGMR